ncbi:MAG: cation transporter [Rubritepida sp.]|nr:cation transporter [Rubritepida sp.]MCU0944304.1 cation transporter [Rubritepida sp.]
MEFAVSGMGCGHCVRAITDAVQALDPAAKVTVAVAEGQVRVESVLPRGSIAAAIVAEGYATA